MVWTNGWNCWTSEPWMPWICPLPSNLVSSLTKMVLLIGSNWQNWSGAQWTIWNIRGWNMMKSHTHDHMKFALMIFFGPLIHEVPVYNFCRPLGISVGRYVKNRLHRGLAWPSCRHELLFARNPQLICDPLHSHGGHGGHGSMSHVLSKWKSEAQMIFHSNSAMRLPFFWSASMSAMFVRFPIQQWFEFEFPKQIW